MADLLPLFPLGTVLLPGAGLPLRIFEPRYRALLADVTARGARRAFGVVALTAGLEMDSDLVRSGTEFAEVGAKRRWNRPTSSHCSASSPPPGGCSGWCGYCAGNSCCCGGPAASPYGPGC